MVGCRIYTYENNALSLGFVLSRLGITLGDLHPDCKAVEDVPCWEKAVMKNNENEPCPYPYWGKGG